MAGVAGSRPTTRFQRRRRTLVSCRRAKKNGGRRFCRPAPLACAFSVQSFFLGALARAGGPAGGRKRLYGFGQAGRADGGEKKGQPFFQITPSALSSAVWSQTHNTRDCARAELSFFGGGEPKKKKRSGSHTTRFYFSSASTPSFRPPPSPKHDHPRPAPRGHGCGIVQRQQ